MGKSSLFADVKWRARTVVGVVLVVSGTALWWSREYLWHRIGASLVCDEQLGPSQVLLVENFEYNYLVFERATALVRAGVASRVVVPIGGNPQTGQFSAVDKGIANVMAEIAHMPPPEFVAIVETEPITLNTARQLRDFFVKNGVSSVTTVIPGFRSRRSHDVYASILQRDGIDVKCVPVFGTKKPENWTDSWHGIQEVLLQFVKLQYYRFWVLT